MSSIQQMGLHNDVMKVAKELLAKDTNAHEWDIQEYKEIKVRKKGSTDFIITKVGDKISKYGYTADDEILTLLTSPKIALILDTMIGGPAWFACDVVAITHNTLFGGYNVISLKLIDDGDIAIVSSIKPKEEQKEETERDRMMKFFADNGHDEHSPWRRK